MLSWLANAWRVPELRRRVLFTAGILAAYRLGSWIPSPGVNASASAREKVEAAGGSLTLLREPKERLPKRRPQSARPAPAEDEPEQEETEPQAEAEPDLEPEGEPDAEPEPEGEEG